MKLHTFGSALTASSIEAIELLFENLVRIPFFIKDRELRYIAANPAMQRLCGVSSLDDLLGRTASDFFPERLARRYEAMDREILETGRPITNAIDLSLQRRSAPIWLVFSRRLVQLPRRHCGPGVMASAQSVGLGDPEHAAVQRLSLASDAMHRRLDARLEIAQIASDAGVSASQLQRDFRRILAMTPRQFHTKLRIEHAVRLLEGDETIACVAQQCGYCDHSAFTRSFLKLVGMTPSRYRTLIRC